MTRARDGATQHVLRINPSMGTPDYLIAYQCGFLLRHYQVPEQHMKDIRATAEGRATVKRLIATHPSLQALPSASRSGMIEHLLGGVITQLRSMPVGMRIDAWIASECPNLANLQRASIRRQLEDNLAVISSNARDLFPQEIYAANVSMNAAYAIAAAGLLGEPAHAIPYQATGYHATGQSLIDLATRIPADPASDVHLIDAWASELSLEDWYEWIPA